MTRSSGSDRPEQAGVGSGRAVGWTIGLSGLVMLLAIVPVPAHAQFGALKKLKNKVSSTDSSARARDSLAQIAAGVLPESVKINRNFLKRSAAVMSSANGALEEKTGISAKDAALAATGVGASNLVAKKLGMDPMSIGQQAIANARMSAQQRAAQRAGGPGSGMPGAGSGGMDAVQLQAMQRAAMANAAAARPNSAGTSSAMAGSAAMAGITPADADALVAFQQEMMDLSMAASAGDAKAKARLEAWQTLALKYQVEMQKLSVAASAGDANAVERMQRLQFDMIKEWSSPARARAKTAKARRP